MQCADWIEMTKTRGRNIYGKASLGGVGSRQETKLQEKSQSKEFSKWGDTTENTKEFKRG